jgi:hypothetical protein
MAGVLFHRNDGTRALLVTEAIVKVMREAGVVTVRDDGELAVDDVVLVVMDEPNICAAGYSCCGFGTGDHWHCERCTRPWASDVAACDPWCEAKVL